MLSNKKLETFKNITQSNIFLTVIFIITFISIYWAYKETKTIEEVLISKPGGILSLYLFSFVSLIIFLILLIRKIILIFFNKKQNNSTSSLRTNIVFVFSLIAIIPTLIIAAISSIIFYYGIHAWFDSKVSTAIENSIMIAESYLDEHKKLIKSDVINLAHGINRSSALLRNNPQLFNQVVSNLAGGSLSEVVVFNKYTILAKSKFSFFNETQIPDTKTLQKADGGEVLIIDSNNDDQIKAIIKLGDFFDESYLLVSRYVDDDILEHVANNKGAASAYKKLKNDMLDVQLNLFYIFFIAAFFLLVVAVLFGLYFAIKIVNPISALVVATEKVKEGDFSTRVEVAPSNNEISLMQKAFNRMTRQLERQRTELVSVQRSLVWSDVARRIAHEIKNPLTPIQLASERLNKKYSPILNSEEFSRYINTIIRNVETIGKMVEEFARFARLPAPVFSNVDICEIVNDVVFAMKNNNHQIIYECKFPDQKIMVYSDPNQISQVVNNILKNAEEAINEKYSRKKVDFVGKIKIDMFIKNKLCMIKVVDNGDGFAENIIEHLTEPYVTTKNKGTGLGLAIVKKIIEDHNGILKFTNDEIGGCIILGFPIAQNDDK